MRKLILHIVTLAFLVIAQAVAAADFIEGKHYLRLSPQQQVETSKVEVREFFWYGCPHCYVLEPYLDNWEKPENVELKRTPVTFSEVWITHARVYFVLEALGRLEDLHSKFFEALHKRRLRLADLPSLARFFSSYDIPEKTFKQAFRSLLVETKLRQADRSVKKYKLKSVPTFVVNGKYVSSPRLVGNNAKFIELLNHLVSLETSNSPTP